MKALTRTRAVGGSLVVTIPKELAKEEGFREGELVQIEVTKAKKSYFGIAKGMSPFTLEDEAKAHD